MMGYRLSRTGIARHPFYLTHIGAGLWSVEELCYYVCTNPALVDETVMNAQLVRWIAEEFRLTSIAIGMERSIRAGGKISDVFLPLLRGTGYLDAQELRRFTRLLTALEEGSAAMRLKMKGDALFRNHRYGEAITTYQQAQDQIRPEERALETQILHNRGCALMQLLAFEEAYRAFRDALEIENNPVRLRTCLLAAGLARPSEQLASVAGELGASEDILLLVRETLDGAALSDVELPGDPYAALEDIRSRYHSESGT